MQCDRDGQTFRLSEFKKLYFWWDDCIAHINVGVIYLRSVCQVFIKMCPASMFKQKQTEKKNVACNCNKSGNCNTDNLVSNYFLDCFVILFTCIRAFTK